MRDLVVVGGGPAGLATAIFAAKAGLDVVLVERRSFPVDKPCGEGIMPAGVRLLEEMGVRVERGRPFEGIRYVDGGNVAEARFRRGPGLGIRRTVLSRSMVERASALGVEIREGTRALEVEESRERVRLVTDRGEIVGRWLAAADGLSSLVRQKLHLETAPSRARLRRYGYRRHYRVRPWSCSVEVHWGLGAEAYVTPVGEQEVGVAFLWHEPAPSWEEMLARFPALEAKLRGASTSSAIAGAGPLRRTAAKGASRRIALVGDASGYVDALTGDGVALAFGCARLLVPCFEQGTLGAYDAKRRRATYRYRTLAELALLLSRHPRLRRAAIAAFASRPRWFELLVGLAHQVSGTPTSEARQARLS